MTVACAYPDFPVVSLRLGSSAVSKDSQKLENIIMEMGSTSITDQRLDPIKSSLYQILRDCSKPNWDEYNASPISKMAFFEAIKLLEILPSDIPLPEIVPEPTGNIGLEWYKGKQFAFVISVSGKNFLAYAGMFGAGNETHGTENFTESLPLTIIKNLRRLFQ
jgi:preprotein translocase subunit Sss1